MEILEKLEPEWVPVEDVEFLCAPLTGPQRLTAVVLSEDNVGEAYMRVVRYAVRDWRGVTRGGQPVAFSESALVEFFERGERGPALLALGGAILQRGRLSETERKNS